jgi:type IV pilus assembly protein PilW
MHSLRNGHKGFTLVEMLVGMAVASVVMISIYTAYVNHQRSHVTQQLVVDMQQNARAALALMKREIRMMGYDPVATDGIDNDTNSIIDDESSGADIIEAQDNLIQFSADLNYDGDTADANENITYQLVGTELRRNGQVVAYDIEAIGFAYAYDEDPAPNGDGELDLSSNGFVIWIFDSNPGDNALDRLVDTNDDGVIDVNDDNGGKNRMGPQVPVTWIRAVKIWLLARTRQPIKGQNDVQTYVVGSDHNGPAFDGNWDSRRKRVLLTTTVYCRNMGL